MTIKEFISKLNTLNPELEITVGEAVGEELRVWPINAHVLTLDIDTTVVVLAGCCSATAKAIADGTVKRLVDGDHDDDDSVHEELEN